MTDKDFKIQIDRIRSGDRDGLKVIYEEYRVFIYSAVINIVKNPEDAEDITSEFFIKLWRIAGRYNGGKGHKAWLATIARNMAIDSIRKHQRETLSDQLPEQRTEETPEKEVLQRQALREAMKSLNDNEAEILDMKIVGQLTFKEIAEILNIPMGTVTWRYQNGLKKLRRDHYGEI